MGTALSPSSSRHTYRLADAPDDDAARVGPFVKWAGGKRQLMREILRRVPARIATYHEPFVGGGAVFFALAAEGRFDKAVIGDANAELVTTWRVVQSRVDELLEALRGHERAHDEAHYYRVRQVVPEGEVARAARFIYLNKTGFNGLYRVNSQGLFNVPFGRYARPRICDEPRLLAAARALRHVEVRLGDFADTVEARPGDFVYLDPPYVPLSKTALFRAYQGDGFPDEEQARLAEMVRCLGQAGVACLLSNSDCDFTRELYGGMGLPFEVVQAARTINSAIHRRGRVAELLVRGHDYRL